jgi:hypothetical protein
MVNEFAQLVDYCPNNCIAGDVSPFYYLSGSPALFYIFELANFAALAFFIMIAYRLKMLSPVSMWVWFGLCLVPFGLNYLLIVPWVFGDQYTYLHEITSLKTTGESVDYIARQTYLADGALSSVTFSSHVLGFAPIPNFMTVTSAAFANKFFALITFIWLSRYIEQHRLLFFFLLPSFIIYSSLGLRDNLVILTSMITIIHIANSRYILGTLFLLPLLILKIQMFLFIGIYFIGKLVFRAHKSFKGMILLFSSAAAIALVNHEWILMYLNYYRIGFVAENFAGGYTGFASYGTGSDYVQSSLIGVMLAAIAGLPYFLLMPLPWEWSNPFHIATFLDTTLCLYAIYYIVTKYQASKNQEILLLIACLGIGLLAYSFLVANVSTFTRYRFTLFLPYLLCIYYVARRDKHSNLNLE